MSHNKQPRSHLLITGASSGLGAALARHHAAAGASLSLSGRDPDRLSEVVEACRAAGAEVVSAIIDVTDAATMTAWVEERDEAQPLDLVYANAGIGGTASLAGSKGEDPDTARRIFEVNTLGVVNTVAPLVPRMMERRRGHLVIVSSMASLIALPHSPAYCGSKAAVTVYGEALRRLLEPAGVRLSLVHPGFVDTPMSAALPYDRHALWTADRAARHIAGRVARGARRIDFPLRFKIALGAVHLLPTRLVDFALARSMRTGQ